MGKKKVARPAFTEELMDKKMAKKYGKLTADLLYKQGCNKQYTNNNVVP